jgi:preprotein translocase subunit SecE
VVIKNNKKASSLHTAFGLIKLDDMATTPVNFFKEVKDELKKVVWPTKAEVTRLTSIVILVSLGVGVFLGLMDYIFTNLLGIIIK